MTIRRSDDEAASFRVIFFGWYPAQVVVFVLSLLGLEVLLWMNRPDAIFVHAALALMVVPPIAFLIGGRATKKLMGHETGFTYHLLTLWSEVNAPRDKPVETSSTRIPPRLFNREDPR